MLTLDADDDANTGAKRMLRHLELIDDEASLYGIKLVKCVDKLIAKKYGFRDLPGISYFRKGKNPKIEEKNLVKYT